FDGIDAAFLYPSQRTMHTFMGNEDREFHLAGVRAYNDWLAQEFCAVDPQRLFGLAQMPNLGVEAAIAEMKRCREQGYRAAVITTCPSGPHALAGEADLFSAAAQDLGMPVRTHIPTQPRRSPKPQLDGVASIPAMALAGFLNSPPILSELVMSGLFDRNP